MQAKPNQEARRMRRKVRVRILVAGFFVFVGVTAVLESPLTRVRNVTVSGNATVPANHIIQVSDLHSGMSIWQVNSGQVSEQVLNAIPRISTVSVHTSYWTGQVQLNVKEKPIVALLESNGDYFQLLSDGKVFDKAASTAGFSWPLLTTDNPVQTTVGAISDATLASICHQLSLVSPSVLAGISEIHADKLGMVTIYLDNQFAGQCRVEQLDSLLPALNQAVQYFRDKGYGPGLIDLTGGPPYRYTPYTASANTTKEGKK